MTIRETDSHDCYIRLSLGVRDAAVKAHFQLSIGPLILQYVLKTLS